MFAGLRGEATSRFVIHTSLSTASFESCVFRDLGAVLSPEADDVWKREGLSGTISTFGLNTTLAMQNCTLQDMRSAWPISVQQAAGVYSDNPAHSVRHTPRVVVPDIDCHSAVKDCEFMARLLKASHLLSLSAFTLL